MATAILRQFMAQNAVNPNRDPFGEGVRTGTQLAANRERRERTALHDVIGQRLAAGDLEGGRTAAFRGGDLQAGDAIGQRIAGRQQAMTEEKQAFGERFATFAGQLLNLPEEQQEAAYRATMPAFEREAQRLGIEFDTGPMNRDALRGIAARFGKMPEAGGEGFTLSPGQRRFSAGGREIAAAPESQKEKQGETFKTEQGLRKEFTARQKDFLTQERAWQRIQASAESPSAAGDMAMIFNFMKLLDPGSVVRESEFRTAAQAGSFGQRIQAAVNQVASGERLAAEMRKDFLTTAERIFDRSQRLAAQDVDFFRALAEQANVDPNRVINPARGRGEGEGFTAPDGRTFTEEQIREAMANKGLTREQVIEEIRRLTGGG